MFQIEGWHFFYRSPCLILTEMPGGVKTYRAVQGSVKSVEDAKHLASHIIAAMIQDQDVYQLPYQVRQNIFLTNQHDIDQQS